MRVIGYLPNWGGFLENARSIPFDKITHLVIAFINPLDDKGNLGPTDNLHQVVELAHDNNTKVMMSLGGAIVEGPRWKQLQSDAHRPAFLEKIERFLLQFKLDGIDVDLEGENIGPDYEAFVADLAGITQKHGMEISGAVALWNAEKISDGALTHFDFINMMSYDETGHWAPEKRGPHSTLNTVEEHINYWNGQKGIPTEKLNVGLPFYGYNFNPYTKPASAGFMTYEDILKHHPEASSLDQIDLTPDHTVYYNGIPSIKEKTKLAIERTGGVLIWQLVFDSAGKHSLLDAVHEVISENAPTQENQHPALFSKHWVFATIKTEDFRGFFEEKLHAWIEETLAQGHIDKFIFTRTGADKNELLLFLKTNSFNTEHFLKPSFEASFGEQPQSINDYYLFNLGSENAHKVSAELLDVTSQIAYHQFVAKGEGWNPETAINLVIGLQITLAHSMGLGRLEAEEFFGQLLEETIDLASQGQENGESFKENLLTGLEESFDMNKDMFIGYYDYLWGCLEDDELDADEPNLIWWRDTCRQAKTDLDALQTQGKFMPPQDFKVNTELQSHPWIQEKWPILGQYVSFINGQFGLDLSNEFFLLYTLKQSAEAISEA